jgi:hypothetical protein
VLARTDGKSAARENNMVQASCHCGAVQLTIADAPIEVTDCNCTICRRYGALWAYYTRDKIAIAGSTDVYQRSEKGLEFHRCTRCGCITHWDQAEKTRERMGINCRMMDPAVLSGARVRKLDGFDTWKFLDE